MLPPSERATHEESLGALRSALGDAAFTAAWSAGQALSLEQALAGEFVVPTPPPLEPHGV
jgi:hypothetical protein